MHACMGPVFQHAQPPFARRPNDGFCDDGGAGSETTDCAFGSDCLGA